MDRFSSMDDLPRKRWWRVDEVLDHIRDRGIRRVSAFEMTPELADTLRRLEERGDLRVTNDEYPWIEIELT